MNARQRTLAFWAFIAGTCVFLAWVGWMQPPEGDDWDVLYFVRRHGGGLDAFARWAWDKHSTGDLCNFWLIAAPGLHSIATPIVVSLMMIGMVALATGRVPRPSDRDGWLLVMTASAFVWIGAPATGLDFYNRTYAAVFCYGLTADLWLLFVLVRCAEDAGGRGRAAWMLVLGACGGAANPYLLPITVVAVWKSLRAARRRGPVPAWMWSAALGVVVGGAAVLSSKPYIDPRVFLGGGFEHNLYRLYLFMGECGELVSLVMVILFGLALRAHLKPSLVMQWPGPGEMGVARWGFGAGMAAAFLSVLVPRWGEPSMLASVAAFTVASLALLEPPMGDRGLRGFLVVLGVAVHALAIAYTVPHFLRLHDQWLLRAQELAEAPPGGVAHITPYVYTTEDSWSLGDDLAFGHRREVLAASLGLRAIEYKVPVGGEEGTPDFTFDEVWPDGTRTRLLTGDLDVARELFDEDARARWRDDWTREARLEVVGGLDWPERDGRPLIAARAPDGDAYFPDYGTRTDRNGRMGFHADQKSLKGPYPFVAIVTGGESLSFTWDHREFWFFPERNARYTQLQCNLDECWVVQARWANLLLVN